MTYFDLNFDRIANQLFGKNYCLTSKQIIAVIKASNVEAEMFGMKTEDMPNYLKK